MGNPEGTSPEDVASGFLRAFSGALMLLAGVLFLFNGSRGLGITLLIIGVVLLVTYCLGGTAEETEEDSPTDDTTKTS